MKGYKLLLDELKTVKNVRISSDAVLTVYERPADQSELVQLQRANIGERYLAKLAGKTPPVSSGSDCTATSSTTAQTTTEQPSTSLKYKIGDVVQFKGGAHYASSNATADAGTPKAGAAKVTAIAKGAKHPYHLIHTDKQSTVYG